MIAPVGNGRTRVRFRCMRRGELHDGCVVNRRVHYASTTSLQQLNMDVECPLHRIRVSPSREYKFWLATAASIQLR